MPTQIFFTHKSKFGLNTCWSKLISTMQRRTHLKILELYVWIYNVSFQRSEAETHSLRSSLDCSLFSFFFFKHLIDITISISHYYKVKRAIHIILYNNIWHQYIVKWVMTIHMTLHEINWNSYNDLCHCLSGVSHNIHIQLLY